jgi:hypothetical protein
LVVALFVTVVISRFIYIRLRQRRNEAIEAFLRAAALARETVRPEISDPQILSIDNEEIYADVEPSSTQVTN